MNFKTLMKAAVTITAALVASVALAGPPTYPFGARINAYPNGTKPNHLTNAQMDATIQSRYNDWKTKRLVDVPTVPGGKAVKFSDAAQPDRLTVSEGVAYGMLLTVLMAGYDPNAQALFDGLLTTARARPAYSLPANFAQHRPYLMDWRLAPDGSGRLADGSSHPQAGGGWAAMDADLDIAMALLMAHRQWGSTGTWNYQQEALNTIGAIKAWFTYPDGRIWVRSAPDASRTSDYMFGHFRAFRQATGDAFWDTVVSRQLTLLEQIIANYSPNAGLQPDCVINTHTSPTPPPPSGVCDFTPTEGYYFANAQRNPWRYSTDYLFSGENRLRVILERMMDFFMVDNGGTPGPADPSYSSKGNMAIGYKLDGTRMSVTELNPNLTEADRWPAIGVVAGAMNGAQVHTRFQTYLNDSWNWLNAKWTGNYYDAEMTLLSMIVASGNWWNPGPGGGVIPPPPPSGTKIQAENGVLTGSGMSVNTTYSGYEGTGYVCCFSNAGDKVTVTFTGVTAGTYEVRIRYRSNALQENIVLINGVPRTEQFPHTNEGWVVKTITGVSLVAGSNSIAIEKSWGWITVDSFEIVGSTPGGGGGEGPTPTPGKIQAESGSLTGSGMSVQTQTAGYEGSGYVCCFSNAGDQVSVTFPNVTAGTYNVRIRYYWPNNQENTVVINGTPRTVMFPGTSTWATVTVSNVSLAAGNNTIAIVKDWGWMAVDFIEIVPVGTGGGSGGGTPQTPTTQQVQAESGTMSGSGVSAKTDVAGYQGSAFVGNFSANGDTLTIPFNNVVAGTYNLRIRYHAWGPQENTVSVNGSPRTVQFPVTHPGWAVVTVPGIALPAGNSTVAITKAWGWINVDWVEIAP
jgi:uncharacterized protein (DUF2141 family)